MHTVDSLEFKGISQILDYVLHFRDLCLGVKDFVTKGFWIVLLCGGRDALCASTFLREGHFCDSCPNDRLAKGSTRSDKDGSDKLRGVVCNNG